MDKKNNSSILWAEDDDRTYKIYSKKLTEFLSEKGITVKLRRAKDGDAVYRPLFGKEKFDVILMDLDMPVWGGLDAIPHINENHPNYSILVVSTVLEDHEEKLLQYKEQGLITGYYDLLDFDQWADAVYKICIPQKFSLVHISDLHFGKYHAFNSGAINIGKAITPIINKLKEVEKVDFIIVTGDLTSEAKEKEFKEAETFLKFLADELNIGLEKIIIVPGNHDIYRKEESNIRFRKYIDFLNSFYGESEYSNLIFQRYPLLYNSKRNELMVTDEIEDECFFIAAFNELGILITGMNSVISSNEDEWHLSRISANQLSRVTGYIKDVDKYLPNYFKIALFHHNLFIVPHIFEDGEPDRIVRNQGLVINTLLDSGVKMVLHGHSHFSTGYKFQPYFSDIWEKKHTEPIHIFSTGTLSGTELQKGQSYFHLTSICLEENEQKEIVKGTVTPYKLFSTSLDWKIGNSSQIKFGN